MSALTLLEGDDRGAAASHSAAEILEAVAVQQPATEQLLADLVRAPTLLGAERAGQEVVRRAFDELGLRVEEVPLDAQALRAHPGGAPFSWDVSGKFNLVAGWGPGEHRGGRSLILNGHIDVVSPEPSDLWTSPPFEPRRVGDWLYGRGAGDMKAGLAAIVGAVRGLRQLGLEPLAPVELQSVVEEECTGNGALACVLAGRPADAVIITEPTGLAIQTAQVGVMWFQVLIRGLPAHAGSAPAGHNAIEASHRVIASLRELEAEMNLAPPPPFDVYEHPINMNVGIIQGGDWASTVAARCTLHCRIADYPGGTIEQLRARVEAAVAASVAELPGFDATVLYDGFACNGFVLEPLAPLVPALESACLAATGGPAAVFASTATTDADTFFFYGDSPVAVFGPHAEQIHAIDERVSLRSVLQTAQTLALFIADWCGLTPAA